MSDVVVYSCGFIATSVCAPTDMLPKDVVAEVNTTHPTGIDSPWSLSADATFRQGTPNPGPCEQDASRTHYLLEC